MNEEKKYTQSDLNRSYNSGLDNRDNHLKPSPETRERLVCLETNQKNLMQEIQEVKQIIKELSADLKIVIDCKADKTEVTELKKDLNDVKQWMWKGIGIVATVLFFVSFFKEQILGLFK